MKAILMSIKPQWVAKILNGEKTIEIRKKFPKDYVGWVYIYCTKDNKNCLFDFRDDEHAPYKFGCGKADKWYKQHYKLLNGKVVARFWCDKVEEIRRMYLSWNDKLFAWETETLSEGELEIKACLSNKELRNYLAFKENGYAIHITKLEIFDKPKELSEFWNTGKKVVGEKGTYKYSTLKRPPQSWCYIEI